MANKTLLAQTIPTADDAIHHPPPALALMALEFRVFAEFWTLLPAWPALRRAPAGDGHCVIIFLAWLQAMQALRHCACI